MVERNDWVNFLSKDETGATRSNTSVCLSVDLPADKIKELVVTWNLRMLRMTCEARTEMHLLDFVFGVVQLWKERFRALVPWLEYGYEKFSA